MLDVIRQWLVASASSVPLLLIVEDLHWSTSTTRDALRHVVRRNQPGATADRCHDPRLQARSRRGPRDVARRPATVAVGVARVALHGLDRTEVARLSGAGADDAELILAETQGNPLLVTHLTSDVRSETLPIWLHRRDQLLDDEARAVLDQAATFGTEFDADLLAAAHRAPLLAVLECLEAAEAAGLVVPQPGRARRLRVRPRAVPLAPIPGSPAAPTARTARPRRLRLGYPTRRRAPAL